MLLSYVYLMRGFDTESFKFFIPDPAIFLTKEDAQKWCIKFNSTNVLYGYKKVRVAKGE